MTAQIFFGFREMAFFMIFSSFFFKITDIKKLAKKTLRTSFSHTYSELLSGYIKAWKIWSPRMTAQILLVFEIWRFL